MPNTFDFGVTAGRGRAPAVVSRRSARARVVGWPLCACFCAPFVVRSLTFQAEIGQHQPSGRAGAHGRHHRLVVVFVGHVDHVLQLRPVRCFFFFFGSRFGRSLARSFVRWIRTRHTRRQTGTLTAARRRRRQNGVGARLAVGIVRFRLQSARVNRTTRPARWRVKQLAIAAPERATARLAPRRLAATAASKRRARAARQAFFKRAR